MRPLPSVVVALVVGLAAVAWCVHVAIGGGSGGKGAGERPLIEAVAAVEAGRMTTPVVGEPGASGEVTVTFLARADGRQAPRIVSDVTGWGEHLDGTFDFGAGAMAPVGNTGWFFLKAPVAVRARVEYRIAYGMADYRFDPHNPRRSAGPDAGGAPASEFVTPGYVPPPEFTGAARPLSGELLEASIGGPCRVEIYMPAGPPVRGGFPVAVFLDPRSRQSALVIDWAIAQREIPPVVAAFVSERSPGGDGCSGAVFRSLLTGPLLTWLSTHRGASRRAADRAVLAISYGARDALETALDHPGAFGGVGLLIPGRRITRSDIEAAAARRSAPLRFAILAGRYDRSNLPTAQGLREALTAAGHRVDYIEVPEGHSAVTWRNHLRAALISLFGA